MVRQHVIRADKSTHLSPTVQFPYLPPSHCLTSPTRSLPAKISANWPGLAIQSPTPHPFRRVKRIKTAACPHRTICHRVGRRLASRAILKIHGLPVSTSKQKPTALPREVPAVVVSRLSLYLRELQHLVRAGRATVSSSQLATLFGFTDAQVRKDLAYFGHFGHPGIGYRCGELIAEIRRILGTDRQWIVTMVGVGNMGRALLRYKGFAAQGFRVVAAFDRDSRIVGSQVEGVPVHDLACLGEVVRGQQIQLGMITVPASEAQHVADQLVAAGILGIVNFAPVALSLPEGIGLVGVDLTTELEQLAFSVANRLASR